MFFLPALLQFQYSRHQLTFTHMFQCFQVIDVGCFSLHMHILTKLKRISPKLSNAINKKDVMEVVRGYKSLSSCKKMSEEFSVSTAGKEFAKQIKRGFFQA